MLEFSADRDTARFLLAVTGSKMEPGKDHDHPTLYALMWVHQMAQVACRALMDTASENNPVSCAGATTMGSTLIHNQKRMDKYFLKSNKIQKNTRKGTFVMKKLT